MLASPCWGSGEKLTADKVVQAVENALLPVDCDGAEGGGGEEARDAMVWTVCEGHARVELAACGCRGRRRCRRGRRGDSTARGGGRGAQGGHACGAVALAGAALAARRATECGRKDASEPRRRRSKPRPWKRGSNAQSVMGLLCYRKPCNLTGTLRLKRVASSEDTRNSSLTKGDRIVAERPSVRTNATQLSVSARAKGSSGKREGEKMRTEVVAATKDLPSRQRWRQSGSCHIFRLASRTFRLA